MSKTIELAKHLEKLHINNMYKSDFYWTWDKTVSARAFANFSADMVTLL